MSEAPTGRVLLLVKNALANIVRAFSSSAVTVLLPLCLIVVLGHSEYSVWALIFSLGAFVVYFDLGVPTTVQAMVGRAISSDDQQAAIRVTKSGLKTSGLVSAICFAAAIGGALAFSRIFPDVPSRFELDATVALVVLVIGQTSSLMGNTVSAYFAGQQRSFVPALILAPARVLSLIVALGAAIVSGELVVTAVGYAAPLVIGTIVLFARFRMEARRAGVGESEQTVKNYGVVALMRYSGPLAIWGLCMLVTSGAGVIMVARFDYSAVVPFSIAALMVSAVAGLESSITAPLLPELARVHDRHGIDRVSVLTKSLSQLNGVFLFAVVAGLLMISPTVLPLLAKKADGDLMEYWPILAILLVGNAIHLAGTPLSLALIATKTHTRAVLPPVVEAVISLVLSLWLGMQLGAIGVALGIFIAGVVGLCLSFTWSVKLSRVLKLPAWEMLSVSAIRPIILILPVPVVTTIVILQGGQGTWWGLLVGVVTLLGCYLLLWFVALPEESRRQTVLKVRQRISKR
ncbi:hypothetical protein [Cryobacterium arcticum]|uniref:Polysaccharide biosynthesis protein C-terminal domain-containing protein n=1 Tax=Cryobacterium arcticum TaxID=670052 RepID=A0A1B1BMX4_9MICO|nr:hypothetical protein [Cryobacterium arcticum]ANP73904.1 hypothetical protein PA27867_2967 [Cryobacterium arcticum]